MLAILEIRLYLSTLISCKERFQMLTRYETIQFNIYFDIIYSFQLHGSFKVLIALPPDGGYAWVIVFASFMVNFVIDGIIYSFGKTMVVLADEMKKSKSQMSFVGSLQQSLYYLIGPITSAFVNRFGFRIVVFSGAVVTCVGVLAAAFVSSYVELVLCYGILG